MRLLHIVADYGAGDLAFSEMISALAKHLPDDFRWHYTTVKSFDTLATGFVVAQLGLQKESLRAPKTYLYVNCAPRKDRKEARPQNEGEGLLYVRFATGVEGIIVNSGYSLSFARDGIAELWSLNIEKGGSQFRSRDVFPPAVGFIAKKDYSIRASQLNPVEVIPEPPSAAVGYIDSFGNLKTTFREGDKPVAALVPGQRIKVLINGIERTVSVASGSFNVDEGDIAFAPGSSGHERRFWEIFQRGGSAAETFGIPRVGSEISIVG
jgi:hypothetical protein